MTRAAQRLPPWLRPLKVGPVDPYLRAFVKAAEQDAHLSKIRLVAGNQLIIGRAMSSARFMALSQEGLNATQEQLERDHLGRKEQHLAPGRAVERVEGLMDPWRDALDEATGVADNTVLTLGDAQLWPLSGGDGLAIPALRIPLSAIDAWWVDGASTLSAGKGGGWFIGAAVPIGGD